jgi:hypothetical protein
VVVTEMRCVMVGSQLQASTTMGVSSDRALAPGNIPIVVVGHGETPLSDIAS